MSTSGKQGWGHRDRCLLQVMVIWTTVMMTATGEILSFWIYLKSRVNRISSQIKMWDAREREEPQINSVLETEGLEG